MQMYIAVTDNDWFKTLTSFENVEEVNFWQPSGRTRFRALQPGGLFLFKLHSPLNFIAGGGFFAHSTILPSSLAWDAFDKYNGAISFEEMRNRIIKYKGSVKDINSDFQIGCILLEQPFFLKREDWLPIPYDWKRGIQRGKLYDIHVEPGRSIVERIHYLNFGKSNIFTRQKKGEYDLPRFGKEMILRPRLGQGSFKILVTDAYKRTCAITQEKALPALEAAHIKPFSESGPHSIKNGVLLRSDIHRLFDKGYLTITPDLHVEVSQRIKDEFDDGKNYYMFHGRDMGRPIHLYDLPDKRFLIWHNDNVYKS